MNKETQNIILSFILLGLAIVTMIVVNYFTTPKCICS